MIVCLRHLRRCHRLFHLQLNVQVAELFGLNRGRRIGHDVRSLGCLWEGNHVADTGRVAEDRDDAEEG